MTRSTVAYKIAADIVRKIEHPGTVIPIGRTGYLCTVCGEFVAEITPIHARRCGFVNKTAMIHAGVLKRYVWGKEREAVK